MDHTDGIDVSDAEWVEVTAPLGMEDGVTYSVEFQGNPSAVVYAHDSRSAAAPADDADGHIWFVIDRTSNPGDLGPGDYRGFTKRPGWFWHLRASGAEKLRCVVSELTR